MRQGLPSSVVWLGQKVYKTRVSEKRENGRERGLSKRREREERPGDEAVGGAWCYCIRAEKCHGTRDERDEMRWTSWWTAEL